MRNPRVRQFGSLTAYLDLLFNILLLFVVYFIVTILFVNPKVENENNVIAKAEAMITLTWNKESIDDMDLYVEDPLGNIVYFSDKESGLMHLDRDDLGTSNDSIMVAGQRIEYKENIEIVSIRGWIPGEYIVNVHCYLKRTPEPTNINVSIEKLNPYISLIYQKDVIMTRSSYEATICRFSVDSEGNITDINELPKNLVRIRQ